ncbi:MAG: HEAT repeat domain-containing protein [Gemmataceae bacterium]
MVCSSWKGALVVTLLWAGVAWSQSSPYGENVARLSVVGGNGTTSSSQGTQTTSEKFLFVIQQNGTSEKCRLVCQWPMKNAKQACLVQSLVSGEIIVIVGVNPFDGTADREVYRWGASKTSPTTFPQPPASAQRKCQHLGITFHSPAANDQELPTSTSDDVEVIYQEDPQTGRLIPITRPNTAGTTRTTVTGNHNQVPIQVREIGNQKPSDIPVTVTQEEITAEILALTASAKAGPQTNVTVGSGRGTKQNKDQLAQVRGAKDEDHPDLPSDEETQVLSQSQEVISTKVASATQVTNAQDGSPQPLPIPTSQKRKDETSTTAFQSIPGSPTRSNGGTAALPVLPGSTKNVSMKTAEVQNWESIPMGPVSTKTVMKQDKTGKANSKTERVTPLPARNQSPYAAQQQVVGEVVVGGTDCGCNLPPCDVCQPCCEIPVSRLVARPVPCNPVCEQIHVQQRQPYQTVLVHGHFHKPSQRANRFLPNLLNRNSQQSSQKLQTAKRRRLFPNLFSKNRTTPGHLGKPTSARPLAELASQNSTKDDPLLRRPQLKNSAPLNGSRFGKSDQSALGGNSPKTTTKKSNPQVATNTKLPKTKRKALSTSDDNRSSLDPLNDPIDGLSDRAKKKFKSLPKKDEGAVPPPPRHYANNQPTNGLPDDHRFGQQGQDRPGLDAPGDGAIPPGYRHPGTARLEPPYIPPGSRSVIEASNGFRTKYIPYPVITTPKPNRPPMPPPPTLPKAPNPLAYSNAFAPRNLPQQMANAPQMAMAQGMMRPNPGMRYPRPPMMAGGYPVPPRPPYPGMGNPNYSGMPTPAARNYPGPRPPSPIGHPNVAQVGYPNAGRPPHYPAPYYPKGYRHGYPAQGYQNPSPIKQMAYQQPTQQVYGMKQALSTLQQALSPSDREMAVMTLSQYDHRRYPEVVHALLAAARNDAAGTVRAASVNALVRIQINIEQMRSTLDVLKNDEDPRVRQAVQQALSGKSPNLGRASVRQ